MLSLLDLVLYFWLIYSDQTNSETQRGKQSVFLYSQQLWFMFELLILSKALSGEEFVPADLEADSTDSSNNILFF